MIQIVAYLFCFACGGALGTAFWWLSFKKIWASYNAAFAFLKVSKEADSTQAAIDANCSVCQFRRDNPGFNLTAAVFEATQKHIDEMAPAENQSGKSQCVKCDLAWYWPVFGPKPGEPCVRCGEPTVERP